MSFSLTFIKPSRRMLEKGMLSKIWLWAILLSLLPIFSYAHDQNNSQVLELYVKSGMEKQVEQLPSVIQALFDQSVPQDDQARKLPKEILSAMRASVPEAFAPERLKETILAELTGKLTAQDIKDTLQWLDSPSARNAPNWRKQRPRRKHKPRCSSMLLVCMTHPQRLSVSKYCASWIPQRRSPGMPWKWQSRLKLPLPWLSMQHSRWSSKSHSRISTARLKKPGRMSRHQ